VKSRTRLTAAAAATTTERTHDTVAWHNAGHAFTDGNNAPNAFVPEHRWQRHDMGRDKVRMANAAGLNLDQNLSG
jgi:hypothetical protein